MEQPEPAVARVLIVAPIGRDAAVSAELLARAGLRTQVCRDLQCLMDHVDADVSAILIAEEAVFGKDIAALGA